MKSIFLACCGVFLLSAVCVFAGQPRANPPAQTHCPVTGQPVNGQFFADVEGFRVLTAGPAEIEAVRQNPASAFAWLAKNRQAANPIVWQCPSMRQAVEPTDPFVQQAGKRIYYCCPPCLPRIRGNFKGAADVMRQLAGQ